MCRHRCRGCGSGASFEIVKLHSWRSEKSESEKLPSRGTPASMAGCGEGSDLGGWTWVRVENVVV